MSEKSTISTVRDGDDPPRFTREMAERGRHMVGDTVIRESRPRGRPPLPAEERKEKVTLRLSPDVLEGARGSGSGWQTRVDEQMRRIQEVQQLLLTGREALPRNEIERQLREVMRSASDALSGNPRYRGNKAATSVLQRAAAEHERIATLLAEIVGTRLVPRTSNSRDSEREP